MRILQLSDLHIVKEGYAFRKSDSIVNLTRTVDYILQYALRPDVVVVTGDVSNDGTVESYEKAKAQLERLDCPVYVLPGNHDDRWSLKKVFGSFGCLDPGVDDTAVNRFDTEQASLLFVDSTVPECSYGRITEETLAWVEKNLPEKQKPTMVFMHHIPFRTGYVLMDEPFPGGAELVEKLRGRDNTVVACGHIHTGMITRVQGVLCMTCPSVTMMMSPDFIPAAGDTFYTEPAGFAIHDIIAGSIRSDFCTVPDKDAIGPYRYLS